MVHSSIYVYICIHMYVCVYEYVNIHIYIYEHRMCRCRRVHYTKISDLLAALCLFSLFKNNYLSIRICMHFEFKVT